MGIDIVIAQAWNDGYVRKRFLHLLDHHAILVEDLFGCSRTRAIDIVPGSNQL